MDVKVFINNSEKNKLDKTLINETTYTGQLKSETSILNPVIIIEGNLENLVSYNYAFIPLFLRYYFITDIISIRNNLIELRLAVDVLCSFKNQIRNLTAIIARQEKKFNVYLPDSYYKLSSKTMVQTKTFQKALSDTPFYVLVTNNEGNWIQPTVEV